MLSQPQGHSATGSVTLMQNSNDTIGNRTRDLIDSGMKHIKENVVEIMFGMEGTDSLNGAESFLRS